MLSTEVEGKQHLGWVSISHTGQSVSLQQLGIITTLMSTFDH